MAVCTPASPEALGLCLHHRRSQEDGVEAGVFVWVACGISVVVYLVVLVVMRLFAWCLSRGG
ncbi:MAG: hypothetical protein ABF545_03885, partial [Bifidobacterium psychraerophilum]